MCCIVNSDMTKEGALSRKKEWDAIASFWILIAPILIGCLFPIFNALLHWCDALHGDRCLFILHEDYTDCITHAVGVGVLYVIVRLAEELWVYVFTGLGKDPQTNKAD